LGKTKTKLVSKPKLTGKDIVSFQVHTPEGGRVQKKIPSETRDFISILHRYKEIAFLAHRMLSDLTTRLPRNFTLILDT